MPAICSVNKDKLLMSTGTLPTDSQSTRIGDCMHVRHAMLQTDNACQFVHRRCCLFDTYEDLSCNQGMNLIAACLSKMANLHALGEKIVEWLVVRQDCDANDQHHQHDG